MAEEVIESKREKVPFGKGFWIGNLVIDSILFGLNTGAAVYTYMEYKKGNIKPEGQFLCGVSAGMNTIVSLIEVGSIARDIKRIRQINKAEKETGCPVSVDKYTLIIPHKSDGTIGDINID